MPKRFVMLLCCAKNKDVIINADGIWLLHYHLADLFVEDLGCAVDSEVQSLEAF